MIQYFQSQLPICIYYSSSMIEHKYISLLKTYIHSISIKNNISSIDIFDMDKIKTKYMIYVNENNFLLLCILFSKFNKVIYMDPCIILLENPDTLLSNSYFQQTGNLLFQCQTNKFYKPSREMKEFINILCGANKYRDNPILSLQSNQYQNDKIICIDRQKSIKALHKLFVLSQYYDDISSCIPIQDCIWLSYYLVKQPYTVIPSSTKEICDNDTVLGNIYSFSEQYWLYFDNHIMIEKEYDTIRYQDNSSHPLSENIHRIINIFKNAMIDIHSNRIFHNEFD